MQFRRTSFYSYFIHFVSLCTLIRFLMHLNMHTYSGSVFFFNSNLKTKKTIGVAIYRRQILAATIMYISELCIDISTILSLYCLQSEKAGNTQAINNMLLFKIWYIILQRCQWVLKYLSFTIYHRVSNIKTILHLSV